LIDSKQIEWSSEDIVLEILPNPTRFTWSHFYSSEVLQYRTPIDLLEVRHISSQLLTNQEPGPIVQRNFSHSICLKSILCIGWNWQEIFPDLNTIKDKGQVPDYQIWFVYTLLFEYTLLGPFILMLMLVDQTLCLDQLYSCTVMIVSSLCTPVHYFDWPSFSAEQMQCTVVAVESVRRIIGCLMILLTQDYRRFAFNYIKTRLTFTFKSEEPKR
jgi:hypothetical protein